MILIGTPPEEYTYPKLVLCFFPPENGSAALIFLNLSDGFSVKSPVLGLFLASSSFYKFEVWLILVEEFLRGFLTSSSFFAAKFYLIGPLFSINGGLDN